MKPFQKNFPPRKPFRPRPAAAGSASTSQSDGPRPRPAARPWRQNDSGIRQPAPPLASRDQQQETPRPTRSFPRRPQQAGTQDGFRRPSRPYAGRDQQAEAPRKPRWVPRHSNQDATQAGAQDAQTAPRPRYPNRSAGDDTQTRPTRRPWQKDAASFRRPARTSADRDQQAEAPRKPRWVPRHSNQDAAQAGAQDAQTAPRPRYPNRSAGDDTQTRPARRPWQKDAASFRRPARTFADRDQQAEAPRKKPRWVPRRPNQDAAHAGAQDAQTAPRPHHQESEFENEPRPPRPTAPWKKDAGFRKPAHSFHDRDQGSDEPRPDASFARAERPAFTGGRSGFQSRGSSARTFRRDRPRTFSPPLPSDPDSWMPHAASMIAKATAAEPADAILRKTLRTIPGLTPAMARDISQAVFSYFRWKGWMDETQPPAARIRRALDLDMEFRDRPKSFRDQELIERAVPEWAHDHLEVTADWARTLQGKPKLWLRVRPGCEVTISHSLRPCEPGPFEGALCYQGSEDLFRRREFQSGKFEIQDLSSQAVGLVCNPQQGQTWWDACAGEGGKMLHLSDLMKNKGLIWASDRAAWRLQRLKLRASRAQVFNYRTADWEGGSQLPTKTLFDGILVDAPCSGVGTWHRNPHARWTTTPKDVLELADLQLRLLRHAARALKPGGRLIYAVCTLTRAETDGVANAFEQACPEYKPSPSKNPFTRVPAPRHWFWPHQTGGNGMFVAAWKRPFQAAAAPADGESLPGEAPSPET